MSVLRFGHAVGLVTEKASFRDGRQIALEAIESGTGRLLHVDAEYSGDGVAFASGDVLFGKLRPYLSKAWLADGDGAAVGDFHVYRPLSNRTDGRYLLYVTLSRAFIDPVVSSVYGAKMPRASWDFIRNVEIYLPPLAEQRAIANYLDRETAQIDTLIAKQEQLIATLRERRLAELRSATGWMGALRPGWRWQRLSWVFGSTASGTTPAPEDLVEPNESTLPWVTTGELREREIRSSRLAIEPEVVAKYSALKVHPAGSLLVAMYGATIGRTAVLGTDATSNQACCALVEPLQASARFVEYSLQAAREHLLLDAAGGGQPNINQDKLRAFRIPIPPSGAERGILLELEAKLFRFDLITEKAERFIELAKERRSALITAAVTGQLDVHAA